MIKFFRHIRRSLMETGKTMRYFKYAIGEIVLVVIGILIALQVSNWNQKRIMAISEQVILKDLKTELNANILALENIIDEHEKSTNAALEVKSIISDTVKLESITNEKLKSLLIAMGYNWTYNPKLGILNSTIHSGKMDVIQNKEIRYLLSSIQESIIDASESTEQLGKVRENFYWPVILSNREVIDYENITFDSKDMFRDKRFIWWTKFVLAIRKEGLEEENELLKFLKHIEKEITLEINE